MLGGGSSGPGRTGGLRDFKAYSVGFLLRPLPQRPGGFPHASARTPVACLRLSGGAPASPFSSRMGNGRLDFISEREGRLVGGQRIGNSRQVLN